MLACDLPQQQTARNLARFADDAPGPTVRIDWFLWHLSIQMRTSRSCLLLAREVLCTTVDTVPDVRSDGRFCQPWVTHLSFRYASSHNGVGSCVGVSRHDVSVKMTDTLAHLLFANHSSFSNTVCTPQSVRADPACGDNRERRHEINSTESSPHPRRQCRSGAHRERQRALLRQLRDSAFNPELRPSVHSFGWRRNRF